MRDRYEGVIKPQNVLDYPDPPEPHCPQEHGNEPDYDDYRDRLSEEDDSCMDKP